MQFLRDQWHQRWISGISCRLRFPSPANIPSFWSLFSENYRAFSIILHPRQVQASLQVAESGGAAGSTSLPLKIAACGQQNCLEDVSQSQVQMFSLCPNGDVLKSFRPLGLVIHWFWEVQRQHRHRTSEIGFPSRKHRRRLKNADCPRQKVASV